MNSAIAEPPIKNDIKIPDYLIKEEINGKRVAYRGFLDVMADTKDISDIIGIGGTQAFVISRILKTLFKSLINENYHILTNEIGLSLNAESHVSCDIGIFEKSILIPSKINNQYADVAPKIVMEVGINEQMINKDATITGDFHYVFTKIQALLDFGVEKIIWILPEAKRNLVATNDDKWFFLPWNTDIEILDGVTFNIAQFIENEGVEL
jgi:hypothetical protein